MEAAIAGFLLDDEAVENLLYGEEEDSEYDSEYEEENDIVPNSQNVEKNAKRKKHKKNGKKKSKKGMMGGPGEDVVFVEFLDSQPFNTYYL